MSPESVLGLILLVLGGFAGVLLFRVWRTARRLLDRGIPAVGRVTSVEPGKVVDGSGAAWISTIEYTDITGNTHTYRWGAAISTETVDIVYDPEKPSSASLHVRPTPKAEKFALWVLLLLSWSVALAGLLLLVGVLG